MNKRKRHVADVAFKLFVDKGIQQTSIQDIIDHAKISKGTFYNYFATKNDCIVEILEDVRYDMSQLRKELELGKDKEDRKVLIEQISIVNRLNEERNINELFEKILSSNDPELKKYVFQHRIYEAEWISERIVEVYGEQIRPFAFEAAILFLGMLYTILLVMRISNSTRSLDEVVSVLFSYIEKIIPQMMEKKSQLLNYSALDFLRSKIEDKVVTLEEILALADDIGKQEEFTIEQKDFFDTILTELQRDRIRKSVVQALLNPLKESFEQSPMKTQIDALTYMVWYYIKLR
ncbi:TetR/AcrR family transcriptional regulator [Ornithinibacillus bavariensis]|uniref:TetR family transcriptional regulator n=1 Tax=Ornithinibacillus bavariensis TaxID=545502 RepID=A0A919XAK5_9BACI|nr:TetR/AcrR family transcriptional regulator [Ornithinibacillus bavariensis]GIO28094.1 TetR family transcriptional regulator [Ornithinibacillus bavariensis]